MTIAGRHEHPTGRHDATDGDGSHHTAAQHGTHVASLIFGAHDSCTKGTAPHCRGLILPIFGDGPGGSIALCSQLDLARAILQAINAGANIINISGSELSPSGTANPFLTDAVMQRLGERGDERAAVIVEQGRVAASLSRLTQERDSILTLYRRRRIDEATLDRQLDGLQAEERALRVQVSDLADRLRGTSALAEQLRSAEVLLRSLNVRSGEELGWEGRRHLVELLVEGVRVDTIEDTEGRLPEPHVFYRFGSLGGAKNTIPIVTCQVIRACGYLTLERVVEYERFLPIAARKREGML